MKPLTCFDKIEMNYSNRVLSAAVGHSVITSTPVKGIGEIDSVSPSGKSLELGWASQDIYIQV